MRGTIIKMWLLVVLVAVLLSPSSQALAQLVTYDFTGKVAGSTVENPHVAYALAAGTPDESPSSILAQAAEFSQVEYDGVEADDATYTTLTATKGWVQVGAGSASGGGISNTSGRSDWPSLALDASGTPYVAWGDFTSGNAEIYIKRYDGVDWVEVGAGSASGGGISNTSGVNSGMTSLALDSAGTPYVAWYEGDGSTSQIYIKRYDGVAWVEVGTGSASGGGISGTGLLSLEPSLALNASGTPYVAWRETTGQGAEIYIKRYDGVEWVEVGAGSASGGGISDTGGDSWSLSLALDSAGNPYVAWADTRGDIGLPVIYVKRFDGANWVEVGTGSASGDGISNPGLLSVHTSLALDASDNPYVAWMAADEYEENPEIYIKRYDGVDWVEVGAGSAGGGGISDNSGYSEGPSVALDCTGNPYVAWRDDTSGNPQVYIKRYDGVDWVEVGAGSAGGGGISSSTRVGPPSLALDASDNPYVAWYDFSGTGYSEIYIKRFGGRYAQHLYSFHSPEGSINEIVPGVLAYGTAPTDGVTAQIWNNATLAWELVGSNSASSMPSTPITATFSLSPTDYVDASNKVYLLVRTTYPSEGSTDATLHVDYVKLDVNADLTPPSVTLIELTPNPAPKNTPISLTANVDDSATGASNIASAECNIDGESWSPMSATDGAFDSMSEDVYWDIGLFEEPGVHDVCVRGTDAPGNVGDPECILLAVYDPTAGFITGGGWIWSPKGAYGEDLTLEGKAVFGFVSKYKKGATIPTGQTEFQFKVADLNFHSDTYDWLVIAGARAQYKGSGTINGAGDYGFMLTAIDGDLLGGGQTDKFRIKIWDKAADSIIYDNKAGELDTGDAATELGGGSIVIHRK